MIWNSFTHNDHKRGMIMLDLQPYLPQIDEIEPGETVRINHTDCPAGEDTRRRLYLTRPHADPTWVLAYCHNCQAGAKWGNEKYSRYRNSMHTTRKAPVITDNVEEPKGLIHNISDWPVDAQAWAYKNNLHAALLLNSGIAYDPNTNRVYLPRRGLFNQLMGYQLRKVSEGKGPKYLTVSDPDFKGFTVLYSDNASDDHKDLCGVLVEDYISGLHIREAMNTSYYKIVVNHGVQLNLYALDALKDCHKTLIWLDNDSQHVVNQAKQMCNTLRLISNGTVYTELDKSDAKHYRSEQIQRILERHHG